MGIHSCVVPPQSRIGRGKIIFYGWIDIQSVGKNKAKTIGQMFMIVPLQDNFAMSQSNPKSKVTVVVFLCSDLKTMPELF